MGKKYLTINTDASLKDGIASCAIWIKGDSYTKKHTSIMKGSFVDSNAAELAAITNGLFLASRDKIDDVDRIVINTDSSAAIRILSNGTDKDKYKVFYDKFYEIFEEVGIEVKFKKVKGHTRGKDSRHWVNNWCDRNARAIRENGK